MMMKRDYIKNDFMVIIKNLLLLKTIICFRVFIYIPIPRVNSFVVYWLEWAILKSKGLGSNPVWEPLLTAKAVHLQPVH